IPHTDPFSFTRQGAPWYAWEWGSDVVVGAVHQLGGLSAVACFYALAIAVVVWLWFRLTWALGGNFLIACALAAPMLSTTNIHWLARPHVLSWIFLLVFIIYISNIQLSVSSTQLSNEATGGWTPWSAGAPLAAHRLRGSSS